MNHEENVSKPRIILSSLVLISIQLFLIYKEPDLSTTIAVAAVFWIMIFMAGLSYRIVIGILLVCIPVGVIGMSILLQPDKASDNYQLKRVYAWLRPDEYPQDAMQQQNSIIAIGSGQLYGKGLNNDEVTSVKNGNFIAEAQTDFIFAVAGEETGFVGCCVLVVLEFLIALETALRNTDLLRHGRSDFFPDVYQYFCGNRSDAKYRYHTSVCQLRSDFAGQLLHRHRLCPQCRTADPQVLD